MTFAARLQRIAHNLGQDARGLYGHSRACNMAGDNIAALAYYERAQRKMRALNKVQNWLREFSDDK